MTALIAPLGPLGPHADYILGSYAAAAIVLIGLTASILRDHAAQKKALAALEERGAGRRPGRRAS